MFFSTNNVARGARRDAWLASVREQCGDFEIEFGADSFEASIDVRRAGRFRCARIMQTSRRTTRLSTQVDTKNLDCYFAIVQLAGRTEIEQFGRTTEISEGDIAIIDANAPMTQRYSGRNTQLSLHLPKADLGRQSFDWATVTAKRLHRSRSRLVGPLICSAFCSDGDFDDREARTVGDTLVNLLSIGWQGVDSGKGMVGTDGGSSLLLSIRSFILARLADEQLSPGMIARENGLSERQLHRIFQSTGRTVGGWIRQNRLDRSASDLRDHNKRDRTITQIAFAWGFSDSAHFSRVFSAEYGQSPRAYRTSALRNSFTHKS